MWHGAPLRADPEQSTSVEHSAPLLPTDDKPTRYRLANGLSVILWPDQARDGVAVTMQYAAGLCNDPPGYSGLAHLVEHLTFRGSRHLGPLEAYSNLERVGGTSISASTGPTATLYECVVPPTQLETAIWIESERMAFTLEKLSDENVAVERRIVANEIRQRRQSAFANRILEALLPRGHPYLPRAQLLGDLDAIRLRDVQWFFQRWYRPDNATLVLRGAFDPARARDLIQQYFGPIVVPNGTLRPRTTPAVKLPAVRRLRVVAPTLPARVTFVWVVPRASVTLDFAAFVLEQRLKSELSALSPPGLPVQIAFRSVGVERLLWVDMPLNQKADPRKVEDIVALAVRRLHNDPPSRAELEEARSKLVSSVAFGRAHVPDSESESSPSQLLDEMLRVDGRDVAAVTGQYLPLEHRLIAELVTSIYAPPLGYVDELKDTPR